MKSDLLQKLNEKKATIGIVGLGYVGLPLMLRYCEVGYKVIGFDIDQRKVDSPRNGKSYIEHAGVPAKQIGWISQHGERLDLPMSGDATTTCPVTGKRYRLQHDALVTLED